MKIKLLIDVYTENQVLSTIVTELYIKATMRILPVERVGQMTLHETGTLSQ